MGTTKEFRTGYLSASHLPKTPQGLGPCCGWWGPRGQDLHSLLEPHLLPALWLLGSPSSSLRVSPRMGGGPAGEGLGAGRSQRPHQVRRETSVPSFPQAHPLRAGSGETVGAGPPGASGPEAEAPRQLRGPRGPVCAMWAGTGHLGGGFSASLSAAGPLCPRQVKAPRRSAQSPRQAGYRGVECSMALPFPLPQCRPEFRMR